MVAAGAAGWTLPGVAAPAEGPPLLTAEPSEMPMSEDAGGGVGGEPLIV